MVLAEGDDNERSVSDYLCLSFVLFFVFQLVTVVAAFIDSSYLTNSSLVLYHRIGTLVPVAIVLLIASSPKHSPVFTLLGWLCGLFMPLVFLGGADARLVMFMQLHQVSMLLVPAAYVLWSAKTHLSCGVLALLASAVIGFSVPSWIAFISTAVVAVALAVSFLLIRLRGSRDHLHASEDSPRGLHFQIQVTSAQLRWITFLQMAMIISLIAYSQKFGFYDSRIPVLCHLLALAVVGIGFYFSTNSFSRSRRHILLAITTVAAGLLSFAATTGNFVDLPTAQRILLVVFPLSFLSLTTVASTWRLSDQVAVALTSWILGLLPYHLLSGRESPFFAILDASLLYGTEFRVDAMMLLMGTAFSVLVARVVYEQRLLSLSLSLSDTRLLASSAPKRDSSTQFTPRPLPVSSQERFEDIVVVHIVKGLFGIGLCFCLLSSLLLYPDPSWPLCWVGFFSLWGVLMLIARRTHSTEARWMFLVMAVCLLFVGPLGVVYVAESHHVLWLVLPLMLVFSLSFLPWSISELLPVVAIGGMICVYAAAAISVNVESYLWIFLVLAVSVFANRLVRGALRVQFILTHFSESLQHCSDSKSCYRIFADFASLLFAAHGSILRHAGGRFELLREAVAFPLGESSYALDVISRLANGRATGDGEIGMQQLHWLPSQFEIYDPRCGRFRSEHGVLIFFSKQKQLLGEENAGARDSIVSLFVPTGPFSSRWAGRRSAETLMTLAQQTRERARVCDLHRTVRDVSREVEKVERARDYELSTLVHDINNTVQDVALLSDEMIEELSPASSNKECPANSHDFLARLRRIGSMTRAIATVVSDARRKREFKDVVAGGRRETLPILSMLGEIVEFAQVRAERRRIEVEEVVSGPGGDGADPHVSVIAKEYLETILRNLLLNGIKVSKPGGKVVVDVEWGDEWLSIAIKDQGPGMSEEEMRAIFEPYGARRSSYVDPSLGDYRRFVSTQGGSLDVSSDGAGKGTHFSVTLPLAEKEDDRGAAMRWALVVDDEQLLTKAYARICRALNVEPRIANSVDEAKEIIEKFPSPILVLTDFNIGEGSGLEWVSYVRGSLAEDIPIVVVTGNLEESQRTSLISLGVFDILIKPVGQRALFEHLERALEA